MGHPVVIVCSSSLLSDPELHVELELVGVVADPVVGREGPPARVDLAPAAVPVRLLQRARALPLLLVPTTQVLQ